jgi:hypothetical protein
VFSIGSDRRRTSRSTALSRDAHQVRSFGTSAGPLHSPPPSAYSASWSCPRLMYSAAFDLTYLSSFCASSLIRRKLSLPHWAEYLLLSFYQCPYHPLLVGAQGIVCAYPRCLLQSYIITSCTLRSVGVLQCALVQWKKHHGWICRDGFIRNQEFTTSSWLTRRRTNMCPPPPPFLNHAIYDSGPRSQHG